MSAQSVLKFIAIIEAFYPRPKFSGAADSEAIWLRSMQEFLGGYDEPVLLAAAKSILKNRSPSRDGTMFPKPAECIAACDDAKKLLEFQAQPPLLAPVKTDDWSDERLALALDLVHTEIGRQAAREGWILRLYDFCRREMRLPQGEEISRCMHEAKALYRAMDEYRAKEPSDVMNAILAWGEAFERRRDELASLVLGGKRG